MENYNTHNIPIEELEIGKVYYVTEYPEYERNNEGYGYLAYEPEKLLVKIINKNTSKHKVTVEIIRDYEYPRKPVQYPPEYQQLYTYSRQFYKPTKKELVNASRKNTLNSYKQKMIELRGIKKSGLPNNITSTIGSYVTGIPVKSNIVGISGKSLKQQEKNLQKHIKFLEKKFKKDEPNKSVLELNGGRKTRRNRSKRGFKSLKRKTT